MAQVIWSRTARANLREIVARLEVDSPTYARSFALELRERVAHLERFPDRGRLLPEDRTCTYRELIVGNYRVIYRREGDLVAIVAVVHGARTLQL